jgi:hypothetical protein
MWHLNFWKLIFKTFEIYAYRLDAHLYDFGSWCIYAFLKFDPSVFIKLS